MNTNKPTDRMIAMVNHPIFVSLLLAIVTFAVFWQVKDCGFINYDDPDYFAANTHVQQGLTRPGIAWAFTTCHTGNWHPLTWLSLMFDAQEFGRSAAGPHVVNLLIHVANTILLFLALAQLTSKHWRSAFVAGLFALHPLHVESVAWISERKDVLSVFFGLLALIFYSYYARQRQTSRASNIRHSVSRVSYFASLIFFAFSLMAKPMLLTLPFLLLLLDYWPLGRFTISLKPPFIRTSLSTVFFVFLEKTPFLVLSLVSSVITFVAQQKGGAVGSLTHFPMGARIGNALISYVRYLIKMIWPRDLALPYPHVTQWPWIWVASAAVFVVGLSAIVFFCRRKFPFLFTGWFWFLGTLFPVIGLVQVGHHSMADRYTYVPLIGIFIALTWSAALVFERLQGGRAVATLVAISILTLCGMGTVRQLRYWTDSVTLFEHTLAVTSSNPVAHESLAAALRDHGKLDEAVRHHERAIALKPDFAEAYNNLGDALAAQGRYLDAIRYFEKAIEIKPDYAEAFNNLGTVLSDLGRYSQAIEHYENALRIKPNYAEAHNNLANALRSRGKVAEAIEHYYRAFQLKPHLIEAYYNLAITYANLKRTPEAIAYFQKVLEFQPNYAEAHYELGIALQQLDRYEAAIAHYQTVLKLSQKHLGARNNLAWLLATCPQASFRNGGQAVELALQADRLSNVTQPEILDTLAASYAEAGRFNEAIEIAQQAIQLANARSNAVLAYAVQNRLRLYEVNSPYHEKP